jgi:hypothetical protein
MSTWSRPAGVGATGLAMLSALITVSMVPLCLFLLA